MGTFHVCPPLSALADVTLTDGDSSVDCTHCDLMDPLMKQLTDETGMTLRKFEVWYNDDNLRLLQRLDKVRFFLLSISLHSNHYRAIRVLPRQRTAFVMVFHSSTRKLRATGFAVC